MNSRIIISALLVLGAGCASGGSNDAAPTPSTAAEAIEASAQTAATPAPVATTASTLVPPPVPEPETTQPPPPQSLALPDPCRLITHAEAEAVSGFATRPGEATPIDFEPLGTSQMCVFLAADTPPDAIAGVGVVRVGVLDLGDGAAEKFADWQDYSGIATGSIEGLGDDNFVVDTGDAALLYLRRGHVFLHVSALVPGGLAHATAIAERALTRF